MITFLRRLWMRALLRGVHFSDRHEQLDQFYRVADPWGMDSDAERFRFDRTNAIIARQFGHPATLLEMGCGEGHQSLALRQVCERLFGVDVSARAVERAKSRCPTEHFQATDIFSATFPAGIVPFDVVTACEVLYYVKDVAATIAAMEKLGKACLATYVDSRKSGVDPFVLARPGVQSERFSHGDITWTAAWWRPQHALTQG